MTVVVPCDLTERLLAQNINLQIQIGDAQSLLQSTSESALQSISRPNSRPDSARPICKQHSNWSSAEEIPTIPTCPPEEEEEELIVIDEEEEEEYEPPEPIY